MKRTLLTLAKIITVSTIMAGSLLFTAQPAGAFFPDPPPGSPGSPGSDGLETRETSSQESICTGSGGTWANGKCSDGGPTLMGTIGVITNILLFLAGAIAVIMIIVGGIRYITSSGDNSAVEGAKNTILYAVIGLVVTFVAYAIVNFVIVQIFK